MPKITKVEQAVPSVKRKKKVAAYARISMETERMNHSLSAQISYYSSLIQKNPDWEYAGVFADNGISGTGTAKREEFRRMIEAADNGQIDIILTNIKTPYLIQKLKRENPSKVLDTKAFEGFLCLMFDNFYDNKVAF